MIQTLMADDLPVLISHRLQLSPPGRAAQKTMEPELAYGRHFGPARFDARPAAVVALLHRVNGQWYIPLMLRPEALTHHAGQISLPGGAVEVGERTEDAALRELDEELGVDRFGVLLLGQLSPLYLYGSNFLIAPWVAAARSNVDFRPNAFEVERVIEMPLARLLDPSARGNHVELRGGIDLRARISNSMVRSYGVLPA